MADEQYTGKRPPQRAEVVIEEPRDIPPLVEEALVQGEDRMVQWLFDHQEADHISRGYSQPIDPALPDDIDQVRRGDGGDSWYHEQGNSRCYTIAVPKDRHLISASAREWFNAALIDGLADAGFEDVYTKDDDPATDIYSDPDCTQKLIGTSIRESADAITLRACWYDETPDLDYMLDADLADSAFTKEDFYDSVAPVNRDGYASLYETIRERLDLTQVSAQDVYSAASRERAEEYMDVQRTGGTGTDACVLSGRTAYE